MTRSKHKYYTSFFRCEAERILLQTAHDEADADLELANRADVMIAEQKMRNRNAKPIMYVSQKIIVHCSP